MIACPYRAFCLERWHIKRLDFRCCFENHNLLENCPRHERQHHQAQTARTERMDSGNLEQRDRDYQPAGRGGAAVQLQLGGGW